MPRPTDLARRAELLQGTIRYAAAHGLANISLRPLAEYLGTSSRMLVHYFGTKEQLLDQVLVAARPDIPALLNEHAEARHRPEQVAMLLWQDLVGGGEQEPRLKLLLQVMTLALTQPETYGSHARQAVLAWIDPLSEAMRRAGVPARQAAATATLLISGLRGLALDRYLTGDVRRTDDAANDLIARAVAGSSRARHPAHPAAASATSAGAKPRKADRPASR